MSHSQDKLILLLDTGTSPQVRRTAATQLADLTAKIFRAHGPAVKREQDDVKPTEATLTFTNRSSDEGWTDVLATVSRILPLLHSRSSETRHAAAHALGLLTASLPSSSSSVLDLNSDPIDLPSLIRSGHTLLASAGREYIAKPLAADKAKRRKAMMGSIGLGDAVGWGDDVDEVIGDDEGMEVDHAKVDGRAEPLAPPKDIFEGLSARQITMIKRKKGNMVEEANK